MTGENTDGYTPYLSTVSGIIALFKEFAPVYINQIVSLPVAIATGFGLLIAIFLYRKKNLSLSLLAFYFCPIFYDIFL
jgi:hypothetical protein